MKKVLLFIVLGLFITLPTFAETINKGDLKIDIQPESKENLAPKLKISKWQDQASYETNLLNYDKQNQKIKTYEKPQAYEYEVTLFKKPKTNILSFDFSATNVIAYYQPALTQEEIDEGAIRPINVIGSYALYAATQQQTYLGYTNYGINKIGHIYRPEIIDSVGVSIWGDLNIKNNLLTITIPQDFLNSAIYPIIVDPTFGYATSGASWQNNNQGRIVHSGTSYTASTGTTVSASIFTYTSPYTTNSLINVGIYTTSSPSQLVGTSLTADVSSVATGTWTTKNFVAPFSLSSNIPYYLAWSAFQSTNYVAYDSIGSVVAAYCFCSFDSWPATTTWNNYAVARQYSIYITYATSEATTCEATSTPPEGGLDYTKIRAILLLVFIFLFLIDFMRRHADSL